MNSKTYAPRYLDEPNRYFGLPLDEFIIFIVCLLVTVNAFDYLILGILCASVVIYAIKKIKKGQGQHYLKQIAYWYLPNVYQFRFIPPSCVREYIG